MRKYYITSFSILIACGIQAQLYHGSPAPLQDHMHEVNVQWTVQGYEAADAQRMVAFGSEAERIAMHLHQVRAILGAHPTEAITPGQAHKRSMLLGHLARYADYGVFPKNHVLPYRNPIFIDPHGTACAVGQLMIESGHAELAEWISSSMNNAYVLDMQWPEIVSWAAEHGFTAEELAWIQPGYAPTHPWAPLGGGTNGPVNVLLPLDNGDLLVAGDFSMAGGVTTTNVAIWNGASYTTLGGGLEGDITCAVQMGPDIYIGGSFLGGGIYDLARWDGMQWSYFTIFEGKLPLINALQVHNGELYAAGETLGFAGTDHHVRVIYTDGTYSNVGSQFDERVLALASYSGQLVAGGEFTGLDNGTDPLIAHLAVLDADEWVQLAEGTDAPVRTLLVHGGDLFIGGDLFVNGSPTFGLARLPSLGAPLELLEPHAQEYFDPSVEPSYVDGMVVQDGGLYFGGRFFIGSLMLIGRNIGRYDLGTPAVEPMIMVDEDVHALALHAGRLVAGGTFSIPYANVVALDFSTSIEDLRNDMISIFPNPATDHVLIGIEGDEQVALNIAVHNAAGGSVNVPVTRLGNSLRLDVTGLASGWYAFRSTQADRMITGRFHKE